MDFSQLHERVRIEMLRRIDNGSLTVTLLAHQIDCSAAHVSNFLNNRRRLSLATLDKLLRAQFLTTADLYPERGYTPVGLARSAAALNFDSVPLVEPAVALSQARIPSAAISEFIKVRSGLLGRLRDKCSAERRTWDRFVAVQIADEDAALMQPVLPLSSTVLIDRHYNSTVAYAAGKTTIYAVRLNNRLRFRYAALINRQLILRPHDSAHVPELVPLSAGQTSSELLVGRVFLAITEL